MTAASHDGNRHRNLLQQVASFAGRTLVTHDALPGGTDPVTTRRRDDATWNSLRGVLLAGGAALRAVAGVRTAVYAIAAPTVVRIFSIAVFRFSSAVFAQYSLVEQLERQVAAEPVVAQVAQDLAQRRDAVAGVDPIAVVEGGRVGRLGVVVEVHQLQGRAVDLLQGSERRAALVKVEHVEQQAGIGRVRPRPSRMPCESGPSTGCVPQSSSSGRTPSSRPVRALHGNTLRRCRG